MPRTTDPPVSQAQRAAMGAAAGGHSNLGIPKSVGAEFIEKDPGGKLPERAHDAPYYQVGTAGQTVSGEGYAPVTGGSLTDIARHNEDFWRQRAAERPLSVQPDYRRPVPVGVYHDRFRGDVGPEPEPLEWELPPVGNVAHGEAGREEAEDVGPEREKLDWELPPVGNVAHGGAEDVGPEREPLVPIHPPLTGTPRPLQITGAPDSPLRMKNLPVYKDRFRGMDQVTPTPPSAPASPASAAPMSPTLPTVTMPGPVTGAEDAEDGKIKLTKEMDFGPTPGPVGSPKPAPAPIPGPRRSTL